jgi:hypothetical protein
MESFGHRITAQSSVSRAHPGSRCAHALRSKAVRVWLESDEPGRLAVVANYFHHSVPSGWEGIQALDITPLKGEGMAKLKSNPASAFMASFASMDPMYVVEARKAQ